jgi:hypothetical protein
MYSRHRGGLCERKSTVCGLNGCLPRLINSRGTCHLNPQPVSFLAALALPGLVPRVALLALRFRFKKYAQHTFSTETERRKNSGSSQSLASLLRLTEPTNQSTNLSNALNNQSTRSTAPGTVAISDVEAGTACFVDNGRLGVLVRLELYPDKDGPDFHLRGHEPRLGSPRPKPITT